MAKIESKNKQNPKLQQSELKDGRASLYLEFYLGRSETPVLDENGNQVLYTSGAMAGKPKYQIKHIRKRENLNLYIWLHPRNTQERLQNRNTLALAEKLRFEREQEFLEDREGYRLKKERQRDFLEFYRDFFGSGSKLSEDMRNSVRQSYNKFMGFISSSARYSLYDRVLRMEQLSPEMVLAFTDYLKANGKGEGPKGMYVRFKMVVTTAVDAGLMKKHPCKGITIKWDRNTFSKEILSPEEIRLLMNTRFKGENTEMQRAFIFCLFTGLRWCDVKELKFSNIDPMTRTMRFQQKKVRTISSKSWVTIPLNDDMISLIGEPKTEDRSTEPVFKICRYVACNQQLKKWIKAAGIKKHISWHCSRHSFAVNLLSNGANIKTVADLMGHSSITMTEKYLHVVDSLKQDAINSLGSISYAMP